MKWYMFLSAVIISFTMNYSILQAMLAPQTVAGLDDRGPMEDWLKKDPDAINKPDVSGGRTALYYAVSKGKPKNVEWLLAQRANPNIAFEADGTTPFLIAAKRGLVEILTLLLDNKITPVDVYATDKEKNNVLHMAVEAAPISGDKIVSLLSKKRPEEIKILAHNTNNIGQTPLQLAIAKKARPMFQVLRAIPGVTPSSKEEAEIARIMQKALAQPQTEARQSEEGL